MNLDKQTDYKTLQKLSWGFYAIVCLFLFTVLVWLGVYMILDKSVSSSGMMIIGISGSCLLMSVKYFKDKFKHFN